MCAMTRSTSAACCTKASRRRSATTMSRSARSRPTGCSSRAVVRRKNRARRRRVATAAPRAGDAMPRIHLHRFDDVLDVLGGLKPVADLGGDAHSTVHEWRANTGLFPARYFFVISPDLREWDCDVADALFDFTGHRHRPIKTPRPRWSEARRKKILDGKTK